MPFGVEAPIKHYFASPNEFFKLNVSGYVQTAPMREDNFADIKQELRAVYVPMSSIMRDYLSITSANRDVRKDDLVPLGSMFAFDLDSLLAKCFVIYCFYRIIQVTSAITQGKNTYLSQGFWYVDGTSMLDLATPDEVRYVQLLNAITSQSVPESTNFNFVLKALEAFVSPLSHQLFCFDVLRLLDQLEYGNFIPSFNYLFERILTGVIDPYFELANDAIFGIYFSGDSSPYHEYFPQENLSLFPIIAYQYYINVARRSNYRQPFGELFTCDAFLSIFYPNPSSFVSDYGFRYVPGDPNIFIFDWSRSNSSIVSYVFAQSCQNLLDTLVNMRGLRNLSGDINSLAIYLFSLSNPLLDSDLFTSSQLTVVSGSVPGTTTGLFTSNPVQEMNNLEALYKLRQDLLRAGIRRDKQMESVFGVKGNAHVYEKIQILDVASHSISIDPVISTAETDEGTLGERASRGNGKNNIHCSVTAEDYGFIFITSCFTAEMFYEAFYIARQHYLGSKSWYLPQFAHLGLDPIRRKSLSIYLANNSSGNALSPFHGLGNDTIGFSSHDWNLKTSVNLAHGLFTQFGFGAGDYNATVGYDRISNLRGNAMFGGFVPTLIEQQNNAFADATDLYFRPDMVNNLFQQMVDFYLHVDPSFDFFKCAIHYEVHKVSTMPKIGLLNLNV